MKQSWLEDFLALVELGTFSRAAAARSITQPAFSRRIRALEEWLDVELIERRCQPVQLTPIAEQYVPEFRALLHNIKQLQARMRIERSGAVRLVLATQHSLTMTRLPELLRLIGSQSNLNIDFKVRAENRDESVGLFMRGQADLLLCIEETHDPLLNLIPKTARLDLGIEKIVPVSALDGHGKALHTPLKNGRIKVLAFPPESYMGRVMQASMSTLMITHDVEVLHESVFLAGVKEMVKAGLGLAWLPLSLVDSEIQAGELINLSPQLPVVTMQISLYRHAKGPHASVVQSMYDLLEAHHATTQDSQSTPPRS